MATERTQLFFFGDEILSGWGDQYGLGLVGRLNRLIHDQYYPVQTYNLGVSGEDSKALTARMPQEFGCREENGDDNRVVLCFGIQDSRTLGGQTVMPLKDSIENTKLLLALLKKQKVKHLMIGPPAVYDPNHNARVKKLHHWLEELCHKTHTPYISIWESTEQDPQYKREVSQHDRVLPKERGYEKIFNLVANDRQWWYPQ